MVSSWLSQESALALYTLLQSFTLVLPSLVLVVGNIVPPSFPLELTNMMMESYTNQVWSC